jgi:hypothetical protein
MANKAGPEEDWKTRALEFGEAMGDLLRVLEGVETGSKWTTSRGPCTKLH